MKDIIKKSDLEDYINFLTSSGINLRNFQNILELNSSVLEAFATDTAYYSQFLLSSKVSYTELYIAKLNGALGYITEDQIETYKLADSDQAFIESLKTSNQKETLGSIDRRNLRDFDLVISHNISPSDNLCKAITKGNITNFAICSIIDEYNKYQTHCMTHNINYLNSLGIDFDLCYDTDGNKGFCLIKSKKPKI